MADEYQPAHSITPRKSSAAWTSGRWSKSCEGRNSFLIDQRMSSSRHHHRVDAVAKKARQRRRLRDHQRASARVIGDRAIGEADDHPKRIVAIYYQCIHAVEFYSLFVCAQMFCRPIQILRFEGHRKDAFTGTFEVLSLVA